MADFTLGPTLFPVGTTVGVYDRKILIREQGGPVGAQITSGVVGSDQKVTFTGLAYSADFHAAASVGGTWQKVAFSTAADPALSSDVAALNTRTNALEGSYAVVKEAPLNVKEARFGALGNGTGNDIPAIHAARDLCVAAGGGRILLPGRGSTYRLDGQLNFDDTRNIELIGEGTGREISNSFGTSLNFVGNPAGGHLSVRRTQSMQLKRLIVLNGNNAYTGYVIDARATGNGTDDTRFLTLEDVNINGAGPGVLRNPAAGLCIANSHTFTARRSTFSDSQLGVLGRVNISDYAINASFDEGCKFQNNVIAHIKNAGESWAFRNPTIEPIVGTLPGFYKHGVGFLARGFLMESPWLGDATVNSAAAWIEWAGSGFVWVAGRAGIENNSSVVLRTDANDCRGIKFVGKVVVVGGVALVDFGVTTGHTGVDIDAVFETYTGYTAVAYTGTKPGGLVDRTRDGAWHEVGAAGEPAFTNGWLNFGAPYNTAAYRIDPSGTVYLKGLIKSGTLGTAAFTLPAGFRPPANSKHATRSDSNTAAEAEVTSAGAVAALQGSTVWTSLDGINFKAA